MSAIEAVFSQTAIHKNNIKFFFSKLIHFKFQFKCLKSDNPSTTGQ